jgi:hypothetical protein
MVYYRVQARLSVLTDRNVICNQYATPNERNQTGIADSLLGHADRLRNGFGKASWEVYLQRSSETSVRERQTPNTQQQQQQQKIKGRIFCLTPPIADQPASCMDTGCRQMLACLLRGDICSLVADKHHGDYFANTRTDIRVSGSVYRPGVS